MTSSIPLIEMDIGVLHADKGDTQSASRYYARALDAWEKSGETTRKALLLNNLGVIHHMDGNYEEAFTVFEKGLEACEQCGDRRTQALTICSLGDLLMDVNDFEQARRCYEEALTVAGRLNDNFIIFYSTISTARLHCTLVPYWAGRLGKKGLFARQVSARGGELWCEDRGERVKIAGRCVKYLEGTIELPGE